MRSSHRIAMIPLPVVAGEILVFDVDHIRCLRQLGIVGVLSGTLPAAPQQNLLLGIPLRLSGYDAMWLVNNSHAVLYDSKAYYESLGREMMTETSEETIGATQLANPSPSSFHVIPSTSTDGPLQDFTITIDQFKQQSNLLSDSLYDIYSSLRDRGYWILPGLRFGGDFVAYPGDPLLYHSHLIVSACTQVSKIDLVQRGRLATGVKKLWCVLDGPHTFSIEWAGFG